MKKKKESVMLDKLEQAILERMQEVNPLTDEYAKLCDRLQYVTDLKKKNKKSVSPDTIALISANLAGIILVLVWEEKHVIASRAFSMISKLKI